MDTKITFQDLADVLVSQKGLSSANADLFLRTIFEIISEKVVSDGLVKIKGLGTFKLVEVLQRESIDVSTGKRILIPGHTKVTFTPDSTLRDQVNRPFADFQTVVLNDDTSIEEMERIDLHSNILSTIEDSNDTKSTVTDEMSEVVIVSSNIDDISDSYNEDKTIDSNEKYSVIKSSIQNESNASNQNDVQEADSTVKQEGLENEESINKLTETKNYIESVGVSATPSFENSLTEVHPNTPSEQKIDDSDLKNQESSFAPDEPVVESDLNKNSKIIAHNEDDEPDSRVLLFAKPESPSSRMQNIHNIWFYLFYILLTLVLMTISYVLGYFKVLCPCEKSIVPIEVISDNTKTDSINSAKTEEIVVQPQDLYPQVPAGKFLIVGTLKIREMKVGDNLYKIAREEYGDKEFAQYIIVYNQFTNPDIIPKGYPIKLPKLKEIE